MKVFIQKQTAYYYPVLYVLQLIAKNQQFSWEFVEDVAYADLIWDLPHQNTQPIASHFYEMLQIDSAQLNHKKVFTVQPIIETLDGKIDLIATIYYMVNCIQESADMNDLDKFGRYQYENSYQYRFSNTTQNLVQEYMNQLLANWNIKIHKKQSAFFISHDIDTLYGSKFFDTQWALKNKRIDIVVKLLLNEIIQRPHWKNIDRVLKIHSEHDMKSTFFWLVNEGRGDSGIKNADYNFHRESALQEKVKAAGFTNGLHKSSSSMSFNEELEKGQRLQPYNRYHYLRFLPSRDWKKIADSKIEFDSSLGFAEQFGFRNSYGNAFQPFNLEEKKPYNFVEAPLTFMDGTFEKYMKFPTDKIASTVIDFYERNNTNCMLSLLWHNTHFSDYRYGDYWKAYKKIIAYLFETKIPVLSPDQIIKENTLSWSVTD